MGEKLDQNLSAKAMVVMRKAFRTIDAYVSESFKEDDLTPTQFSVLDVLYAKGEMTIGHLIDSILATSGNMTVVIKNMEKKGWVKRVSSPQDKRSFLISLTNQGVKKIEQALPDHLNKIESAFSVLTAEEQRELVALLKKFKRL